MAEYLSMKEVMKTLNVGRSTLRYLINEDTDFITVKLKERRLMSRAALAKFIEAKDAQARKAA